MNGELDRLVREVLKRLAPHLGADGSRGPLVVVLTGATVGLDAAVAEIQGLIFKGFHVRLVCSEMAEHLVGQAVREGLEGFPQWEVLPDRSWFKALVEARGVAVPLLSVNALSKLASLVADTQAGNLILHALFSGKPLVLARDGASQNAGRAALGFGAANPALLRAVEERFKTAASYGATVVGLEGFASQVAALLPVAAKSPAAATATTMASNLTQRTTLATPKRVISGGDVMEASRRGADLVCAAAALVTPLALETAQRHGVRIVRETSTEQGARARW